MKGSMRVLIAVLSMSAVACALGAGSAGATTGPLVITSDTTLTEDHDGNIVIAANDVTLDCAGHTVTGPGSGSPFVGILLDGTSGVSVKDCQVTAFENGIIAAGWSGPSSGNMFVGNVSFGNVFSGLALLGSSTTSSLAIRRPTMCTRASSWMALTETPLLGTRPDETEVTAWP